MPVMQHAVHERDNIAPREIDEEKVFDKIERYVSWIDYDLTTQRRIAAQMLKAGKNRVWIDPERLADVAGAITKQDIGRLISQGVIKAKPKVRHKQCPCQVQKRAEKKRQAREALERGAEQKAQGPRRKKSWIKNVRAQRRELARLRTDKKLVPSEYARLYRMAGAGRFKDKSDLHLQISKLKESDITEAGGETGAEDNEPAKKRQRLKSDTG